MSITDLKPYSWHRVKLAGWFSQSEHHISYNSHLVRTVEGSTDSNLEEIVILLNAAYQLGFSDGCVSNLSTNKDQDEGRYQSNY